MESKLAKGWQGVGLIYPFNRTSMESKRFFYGNVLH